MARKINDLELFLTSALSHLGALTGGKICSWSTKDTFEHRVDGTVIVLRAKQEIRYNIEIKSTLTKAHIGFIAERARTVGPRFLLVSRHINPPMADRLRDANVQFLDSAGNAFLNGDGVFVFVKGTRPIEASPPPISSLFRSTGLQVVFALLCNPGLERASYRRIAGDANVALGSVVWLFNDLVRLGYVHQGPRRSRILVRKEELLDRWAPAYAEQLRPKLLLGRYRAANAVWWQSAPTGTGLWSGEVAAALKTKHLKPQVVTVFAEKLPPELIMEHRISRDPAGDIELMRPFWRFNYQDPDGPMVHPILIYADLMADANARNIETARMIREQYIARYTRET